jgi:hypothetical protein
MEDRVNLIGQCGMNCGICMAYLRQKNKCNGCRAINTWNPKTRVNCKLLNCLISIEKGYTYCYECTQYPCILVKNMDRRYKTRYGMSVVANLETIQTRGLAAFLVIEKEKWKCPSCGGVINVHKRLCSQCLKPLV